MYVQVYLNCYIFQYKEGLKMTIKDIISLELDAKVNYAGFKNN